LLGWVFFALSLIVLVFTYLFIRSEIRKLETIVKSAKEKDFTVKRFYSGSSEFNGLGSAVNELIESLSKLNELSKIREQEFLTILNAIDIPVFIVDSLGRIVIYNRALKDFMRVSKEATSLKYYYEILHYDAVSSFIKDSLSSEVQKEGKIEIGDSIFKALSFPFVSRSERFVIFLFEDVTAIEKVARMKREFISSASHELRTPLSVIKGSIEILEQEKFVKRSGAKFLNAIKENSERMEGLVSDLLKFNELESWEKPLEQEIDLSSAVKNVYEGFLKLAQEKNLDFKLKMQDRVFMKGDEFLIEELIRNLVSNALVYTEKGLVELSVFKNEFATFEVRDTGPGISESDLQHLFEPFFRVEISRNRASGGSGLGLAISKRIVSLHKGHISVESRLGEGTKFTVQFDLLRKIN
jgi:signal transduction histidine kinase